MIRYFPIHLLPGFRTIGHAFGDCPAAERTHFDQMIDAVRRGVATLGGAR